MHLNHSAGDGPYVVTLTVTGIYATEMVTQTLGALLTAETLTPTTNLGAGTSF